MSRSTPLFIAGALWLSSAAFADDGGLAPPVESAPAPDAGLKNPPDAGAKTPSPNAGKQGPADAGVKPAATPDAGKPAAPSDAGTKPAAPDAGTKPAAPDAGGPAVTASDAGTTLSKLPKGSKCSMTRRTDNQVLVEKKSAGSILDCQQEVRTEVRARFCKESRERIEVMFNGDFNGIPIDPIPMHVICPKKDAPK